MHTNLHHHKYNFDDYKTNTKEHTNFLISYLLDCVRPLEQTYYFQPAGGWNTTNSQMRQTWCLGTATLQLLGTHNLIGQKCSRIRAFVCGAVWNDILRKFELYWKQGGCNIKHYNKSDVFVLCACLDDLVLKHTHSATSTAAAATTHLFYVIR